MTAADHDVAFEELMASLDGQLTPADEVRVRGHVAGCRQCREMEADMRSVSSRFAEWTVGRAPELPMGRARPTRGRAAWLSRLRALPVAAGLILAVGAGVIWVGSTRQKSVGPGVGLADATHVQIGQRTNRQSQLPETADNKNIGITLGGAGDGPLLVRTARLALVVRDFDAARAAMERIVTAAGGFTGRIALSDPASARTLSATLRVPGGKLAEVLGSLKQVGQVRAESLETEDVTQQSVDLDARLSNVRTAESRLKVLMEKRTGDLGDVLAVEREIARVRGEIERMEAERKSLNRRISYSTISLDLTEERKAAIDLGPLPVSARLRNAGIDGWTTAIGLALDTTLVILRLAPVVTLSLLVLAFPAWLVRRKFAR